MKIPRYVPLLSAMLVASAAQARVVVRDVTFRPSQLHVEFAGGNLQEAKAGTVPRSARTRGTVPVFADSNPRYEVVLGVGMDVSDEA